MSNADEERRERKMALDKKKSENFRNGLILQAQQKHDELLEEEARIKRARTFNQWFNQLVEEELIKAKQKPLRWLFLVEVFINAIAGPLMVFLPQIVMVDLLGDVSNEETAEVCRWFGCMIFAFGAVHLFHALRSGPETVRVVMSSFLVGDICYTGTSAYWSYRKHIWTVAAMFNFVFSIVLLIARVNALLDITLVCSDSDLEKARNMKFVFLTTEKFPDETEKKTETEAKTKPKSKVRLIEKTEKKSEIKLKPGEYEGERNRAGQKHGTGNYVFPNGCIYEGQWEQDTMEGEGKLTEPTGNTYVGQFHNGTSHGRGKYSWEVGHFYDGCWVNGAMEGDGTYEYSDGGTYVGLFKQNKRHGQGTMTAPDGSQQEGEWVADEFIEVDAMGEALKFLRSTDDSLYGSESLAHVSHAKFE